MAGVTISAPIFSEGFTIPVPSLAYGTTIELTRLFTEQPRLVRPGSSGSGLGFSLDGVDRRDLLVPGSASIQRQQQGRGSASFELFDRTGVYQPRIGAEVVITDGGHPIFGGIVDKFTAKYPDDWHRPQSHQPVFYSVSCVDWAGLFDRRVISRRYPVGSIVINCVVDVINNFLDGTGFAYDTSHVAGGFAFVRADLDLNYCTITEALNRLAQISNDSWWVTPSRELYFQSRPDAPPAPFDINYTDHAWSNLEIDFGNSSFRSREFLRTNVALQAGQFTETYTIDGDFQSIVPSKFPIQVIPELTLNGVPQRVLDITVDEPDQDAWYMHPGWQNLWHGQMQYMARGTVAVIKYGAFLTNVVELEDADAIAAYGKVDMVDEVKDIDDIELAKQIAQGILDQKSRMGENVHYETMRPGLEPGMAQHVQLLDRGIDEQFYIDSISSQAIGSDEPFHDGSYFRHSVALTNEYNEINWQKWFDSVVTRTKGGQAILETEMHGWSIAAEVVATDTFQRVSVSPINWQHNGILLEANVVAATAPIGQDLEIDIRRISDGKSIFVNEAVSPHVGRYLSLKSEAAGVSGLRTFGVNPWAVVAGETFEVWMRYKAAAGSTKSNASGVKIQVELNH